VNYSRLDTVRLVPSPVAAKPQESAQNEHEEMNMARRKAAELAPAPGYTPSYLYPINGPQWKRLAAEAFATDKMPSPHSWRLTTNDPAAAEVLALAAMLRQTLPAGAKLTVEADPEVPAGFARLVIALR
jgi:hypothetical protein